MTQFNRGYMKNTFCEIISRLEQYPHTAKDLAAAMGRKSPVRIREWLNIMAEWGLVSWTMKGTRGTPKVWYRTPKHRCKHGLLPRDCSICHKSNVKAVF